MSLFFSGETSDIVPFFTGLLLASDSRTKDWIADYIKAAQKVNLHVSFSVLCFFSR